MKVSEVFKRRGKKQKKPKPWPPPGLGLPSLNELERLSRPETTGSNEARAQARLRQTLFDLEPSCG